LVDGDDVHGPTTAFQDHALTTDTPLPKAVLQALEELARTRKQALNLQYKIEGFTLNLIMSGVPKTRRWTTGSARAPTSK
jgi:hypothetical protein